MMGFVFVALAGIGAGLRALLSGGGPHIFPWPTLLVNVSGSFLMGLLYTWQVSAARVSFSFFGWSAPQWAFLVGVGFLGSLTTFSSFSLDSVKLFQSGSYGFLALNLVTNNILCLTFCYLGTCLNLGE